MLYGIQKLFLGFKLDPEISRKIAHTFSCLASLMFPLFLDSSVLVGALGVLFTLIMLFAKRRNLLTSIDSVNRKSIGSVLLPFSIAMAFMISKSFNDSRIFYLPVTILAISDPLAGLTPFIFRKTSRLKIFNLQLNKSIEGTLLFFFSSLVISFFSLYSSHEHSNISIIIIGSVIAVLTTVTEALSSKGWDNLTIVLVALLTYISLTNFLYLNF